MRWFAATVCLASLGVGGCVRYMEPGADATSAADVPAARDGELDAPPVDAASDLDSSPPPSDEAAAPPDQALAPPDQALAPPDQALAPPDQALTPPDQALTPPDQAPTPDSSTATCAAWKDWTCNLGSKLDAGSALLCVGSCDKWELICYYNKSCVCNGKACGSFTGTACMVCGSAFGSGCCGL